MNFERVTFGFFLILALSLNVVFVVGDIGEPAHHSVWVLTVAILVNLITTALKLGDRSQIGAILLSSSLVADLLLIAARVMWIVAEDETGALVQPGAIEGIVSLAFGALVANVVSVVILTSDALMSRR